MKAIYLDLFSGISGDMLLGALIDLGVDAAWLEAELARLQIGGYTLRVSRQTRHSISGIKFDVLLEGESDHAAEPVEPEAHAAHVHVHEHGQGHAHDHHHTHDHSHAAHNQRAGAPHAHRTFASIEKLIAGSPYSAWVREKALAVFRRVAEAEAKIHGKTVADVHFHEVGAVDSILDIVGGCLALEALGCPQLLASNVVEGTGHVSCAHGRLPLPAPATLEILAARGIAVTQCDEPHELVTPTGAAFLAEFVEQFGPLRDFVPERVGYGLGGRQGHTRPNVLRAILGQWRHAAAAEGGWELDTVTVLETNLDDVTPEILGGFLETALAAGALDVFYTPVHMKKNRPGFVLTVLAPCEHADKLSELILRETTAFGVRRYTAERRKLPREHVTVQTRFGDVSVKLGRLGGRVVQAAPEYESCRQRAAEAGVPLRQVYEAVLKNLADRLSQP